MDRTEVIKNLRARAAVSPGKHIMMTWEEKGFLDADSWCKVKEVGQVRAWGQFVKGVKVAERARLEISREHIGTVTKEDLFTEEGFTFAPSTFITGHPPEETKMENEVKDEKKPCVVVESEGVASNTDVYVLDPDGKKTHIPFVQSVMCKININDPIPRAVVQLVMPKVNFKTTYVKGLGESIAALFSMLPLDAQALLVEKLVGDVTKERNKAVMSLQERWQVDRNVSINIMRTLISERYAPEYVEGEVVDRNTPLDPTKPLRFHEVCVRGPLAGIENLFLDAVEADRISRGEGLKLRVKREPDIIVTCEKGGAPMCAAYALLAWEKP